MNVAGGNLPPTWWSRRRLAIAAVAAVAIGASAFTYRFNALGGALGGFENDHFTRLIRADALLQGQQPLRDFVDTELRGAWPALTYAASAWAQQLGGRTLLPEAYLTVGALTLAHVIVFLLALDLSKRWSVAVLAAAVAIATMPKAHNYPKVLMLALGVWALRAVAVRPSVLRLGAAALVTAAATLFRHDYGVYVAAGVVAALAARDAERWRGALRRIATYAALTTACLLPSAVWVQVYGGIPAYLRNGLATVAAERTRTPLRLSQLDLTAPLTGGGPELLTYYGFRAVPLVAGIALVALLVRSKGLHVGAGERATAAGLIVMAALVNFFFLRANLPARLGDAAVPIVLLAAWVGGAALLWSSSGVRVFVTAVPVTLLLIMLGGAYVFGDVRRELDTSGLSDSWAKTTRRRQEVRDQLGRLPPLVWSDAQAQGTLVAARYVAECTTESDHLLVIGRLHEIPVLARRLFAAGQPLFELSLYTSDAEQQRALGRLARQSVPIVLAEADDFEDGFTSDYPLVARHLAEHYRDVGIIEVDEEPRIRVFATSDRDPVRSDPVFGLPCFR